MKWLKRLVWPRRRWARVVVLLVLFGAGLVLGPYVCSRAMSGSRALSLETFGGVDVAAEQRDDPVVRISCYNIAHGRGLAASNWDGGSKAERQQRLDDIAALLWEIDADVVVLNEVDFDASWSHGIDQSAYLAQNAGYPYSLKLRNLDFRLGLWRWRFGNAVLSRHQILRAQEIEMPDYATWETALAGKKRAMLCEIDVGGEHLSLIAAHLSHRSEDLRVESAQRLLDYVDRLHKPVVIAGDLNSAPSGFSGSVKTATGQNAIDVIDQSGLYLRYPKHPPIETSQHTFRSDRPSRVIDWVLVPKPYELESYEVVDSLLSDHRPVIVEIRIGGTAED